MIPDLASALEEAILLQQAGSSAGVQADTANGVMRVAASLRDLALADPGSFPSKLQAALNRAASRLDCVSVAVTGLGWLGAGIPSVDGEMVSIVQNARRELALCAYSVTTGALPFLDEVRSVVSQGVIATLIVNRFGAQAGRVQEHLTRMRQDFPQYFRLLDFRPRGVQSELHAKVLTADRQVALIGSANLTFHGLVSNHEMAIIVRGPAAETIAGRLDMLAQGTLVSAIDP